MNLANRVDSELIRVELDRGEKVIARLTPAGAIRRLARNARGRLPRSVSVPANGAWASQRLVAAIILTDQRWIMRTTPAELSSHRPYDRSMYSK